MKDLNQFVGTYPFSKNHPVAKKVPVKDEGRNLNVFTTE